MFDVVIGLFPQYDTIEIKSASTDLLAILYGLFSERFPQQWGLRNGGFLRHFWI